MHVRSPRRRGQQISSNPRIGHTYHSAGVPYGTNGYDPLCLNLSSTTPPTDSTDLCLCNERARRNSADVLMKTDTINDCCCLTDTIYLLNAPSMLAQPGSKRSWHLFPRILCLHAPACRSLEHKPDPHRARIMQRLECYSTRIRHEQRKSRYVKNNRFQCPRRQKSSPIYRALKSDGALRGICERCSTPSPPSPCSIEPIHRSKAKAGAKKRSGFGSAG